MNGRQVERARGQLNGLSQEGLADMIGTSQSTVSRWEARPDEKIPKAFSKRIKQLLTRAKQGLPLSSPPPSFETAVEYILPANAPPGAPRVLLVFPEGPKPQGEPSEAAGAGETSPEGTPPAPLARFLRSGIGISALAFFAGCIMRVTAPDHGALGPRPTAGEAAAATPQGASEQVPTSSPTQGLSALPLLVLRGAPMPEKPEPNWLKPAADGKCRHPQTGERLAAVALRGACFYVGWKLPDAKTCPDASFDPPPEVMKDPALRSIYGTACFDPVIIALPRRASTP